MEKRIVIRNIIVALICALLIGMISITANMYHGTIRNGEEYCDHFLDGQVFEQEVMLGHTGRMTVHVLPSYFSAGSDVGVRYEVHFGNNIQTGFIPLTDCTNNKWTYLNIDTHNIGYVGKAQLKLTAVGLDYENSMQFLITTNALQANPECLLYKDGQVIPNGRLTISYNILNVSHLPGALLCTFLIVLALAFLAPYIAANIRKYPLIYAVAILFVAGIVVHYSSFGSINQHVSAQYFFSWQNLGSLRRTFLGSLIELLGIDFTVTKYIVYGIVCIAVMLALELWILYDREHLIYRSSMEKCFWLFLCMPFSVMNFFGVHFFARFDEVLIIFFLLCCILLIKERGVFLIPILTVMATMTHEMYVALFIPFVFCLLLYKWYLSGQKKYMGCLAATSILAVGMGGYVSFFSKSKVPFDVAWANIQGSADPALVWTYSLNFSYYTSAKNALFEGWDLIYRNNTIPTAIAGVLLLLPVILLAALWIKEYFMRQKDLLGRMIVLLFPCTLAGLLVAMYTTSDWGRLMVMYGVGVFFSFLTLWSMDGTSVKDAASAVYYRACAVFGKWTFVGICVFYMLISNLGAGASSGDLFSFVRSLF